MTSCTNVQQEQISDECAIRTLIAHANYKERRQMESILASNGVDVDTASSGLDVLGLVQKHSYDCIFMDAEMPVMSGLIAACFLKADTRMRHIPLIAISPVPLERVMQANSVRANLTDFVACLQNPLASDALIGAIEHSVPEKNLQKISHKPQKEKKKEKTEHTEKTQDSEDSLALLTGFDIRQGLSRVLNNKKMFFRLLKDFEKGLPECVEEINTAAENGGISALLSPIHKIKGMSGNLAAMTLYNHAVEIEKTYKNDLDMPENQWRPLLEDFLQTVEETFQSLKAFHQAENQKNAQEETKVVGEFKPDPAIMPLLKETLDLVREYATTASDSFNEVEKLLGSHYKAEQERISAALESFDFDQAEQEILALTNSLNFVKK